MKDLTKYRELFPEGLHLENGILTISASGKHSPSGIKLCRKDDDGDSTILISSEFIPMDENELFDVDGFISSEFINTSPQYEFHDQDGTAILLNEESLRKDRIPETVLDKKTDRLYRVVRKSKNG